MQLCGMANFALRKNVRTDFNNQNFIKMDESYYINAMINIWRLKGNSVRTIFNYKGHLLRYLQHFKQFPETITRQQQIRYFLTIKSASHRNQAIAVIRQLHEHLLNDPISWQQLPYCKKKKSLPQYFTEDEVKRLIHSIRNPKHQCFAAIQYLCGLRISEVINLKQTDISTKEKTLRINGKGSKQREINLPDAAIPYLKKYWAWVMPKPRQFLFEGQYGGRYSSRSMQLVINRAKEICGLQHKLCNTHGLRHAAATIRINKLGWQTRQAQVWLGHARVTTTEVYTHVGVNDLKQLPQPIL